MTIGKGDRLFKVRGTDEEIVLRLSNYFRIAGFAEAVPVEVLHLLCPNEAYVEFEALSFMSHDRTPVGEFNRKPAYTFEETAETYATAGSVKLGVLR